MKLPRIPLNKGLLFFLAIFAGYHLVIFWPVIFPSPPVYNENVFSGVSSNYILEVESVFTPSEQEAAMQTIPDGDPNTELKLPSVPLASMEAYQEMTNAPLFSATIIGADKDTYLLPTVETLRDHGYIK